MNMIAAARCGAAKQGVIGAALRETAFRDLQDVVASSGGAGRHPLMADRPVKNVALVLITIRPRFVRAIQCGYLPRGTAVPERADSAGGNITVGRKDATISSISGTRSRSTSRSLRAMCVGGGRSISKRIMPITARPIEKLPGYAKFVSVLRSSRR